MKWLILAVIALIASACSSSAPEERSIDNLTSDHIREMKKKWGATIFGIGGGIPDKVRTLVLDFKVPGPLDIEAARRLIIAGTKDYLYRVNNCKLLLPHLEIIPFPPESLEYSLTVDTPEGGIAFAAAYGGKVVYSVSDNGFFRIVCQESYEGAISLVELN